MKVSAINTVPRINFNGEHSKKANGMKATAGAAMLAIAAAVPAEEASAQYYMPPPPPPVVQYYVPAPVMNIPRCFIFGDETNENYEKTLPDVFNEIDREIEENGQISVNEVVRLEEYNWNSTQPYAMSRGQKLRTAELVKKLSRQYNQYGSDPNTINYKEYKNIMGDYMRSKNVADIFNLMQLLTVPRHGHPHPHTPIMPPPPPPHRHW